MSYTEAVRRLADSGQKFEFPVFWGANLQAEHERYLTETLVGRPVFVTDYPKEIKAFYMRRNDDGKTVAAMDLLVPKIGELIGGSHSARSGWTSSPTRSPTAASTPSTTPGTSTPAASAPPRTPASASASSASSCTSPAWRTSAT
jgi:hypothetical protein